MGERMGVPRELRKLLSTKLIEEGFTNVRQFLINTGVPYSLETVRRAFNECDYKNLDTITLAIIMRHLGYTPKEIKTILSVHIGADDPVLQLIGGNEGSKMSLGEEKLLEAYRKITAKSSEATNMVADAMNMAAMAVGVNVKKQLDAIRR